MVVSSAASQREDAGFNPRIDQGTFLCEACLVSLCCPSSHTGPDTGGQSAPYGDESDYTFSLIRHIMQRQDSTTTSLSSLSLYKRIDKQEVLFPGEFNSNGLGALLWPVQVI